MWHTPYGDRALRGAEWELFREGLDLSWDWIEDSMDDPDLFPFDVEAFDGLQPPQRLALLALVGHALKDESSPSPELTAQTEATVAAVFRCLTTQTVLEIDAAKEGQPLQDDPAHARKLLLAAYCAVMEEDDDDPDAVSEDDEDSDDEDDEDAVWKLPEADSENMEKWDYMLEYLANRILWEDGDYEMGAEILDADPDESVARKAMLGIAEGYFTAIAPDPTDEELAVIRGRLGKICGRL